MMEPNTCDLLCPVKPGLQECSQRGTVKSGFSVFYLHGLFGVEMRLFKSEAFQVLLVQLLSPVRLLATPWTGTWSKCYNTLLEKRLEQAELERMEEGSLKVRNGEKDM